MRKLIFSIAAVAIIFATSCKKESVNDPETVREPEANEFCAEIDNGAVPQNMPSVSGGMTTKTHFNGNKVIWDGGDTIDVNGTTFVCDTTSTTPGKTRAYFKRKTGTGPFQSDTGYHAFFGQITNISGATGNLSGSMAWTTAKESNTLPMYAHSNNHWLTFKNICGVLKVKVPCTGVNKVVIKTHEINNGAFKVVTDAGNTYKAQLTNTNTNDTVIELTGLFAEGDSAYIPLPAGQYTKLEVLFMNGATILRETGKKSDAISIDVNKIYNVNLPTPVKEGYFCITATQTNCTISCVKYSGPNCYLSYTLVPTTGTSTDGILRDGATSYSVTLAQGDKLYVYATPGKGSNTLGSGMAAYNKFTISGGKVDVSGNLLSLINDTISIAKTKYQNTQYLFCGLFYDADLLENAKDLIIPSENPAVRCLYGMFNHCSGLKTAPKLPAEILSAACYNQILKDCPNLETVTMLATSIYTSSTTNDHSLFGWLQNSGAASPVLTVSNSIVKGSIAYNAIKGKVADKWTIIKENGDTLRKGI